MFCHECGKQNPDEAKFCAYCGRQLLTPAAQTADSPPVREDAPKRTEPVSAPKPKPIPAPEPADPHQLFRRPLREGFDVRPILDNPAQPLREGPAATASPSPKPVPPQEAPISPAPPPRTKYLHTDQPAVTSSGGEVMPPSRAPSASKKKPARYADITQQHPTRLPPARAARPVREAAPEAFEEDDLFFEDEEEEEDLFARRLKSIIALLFFVLILGTGIWLIFMDSGHLFRASLGLGAPAKAYYALGDQKAARNELRGAAEAYYSAMKLDPDNYAYSLKVGNIHESLNDHDTAMRAYQNCIKLRDYEPKPYHLLAALLEKIGNAEVAGQWRRMGLEKTGDTSLIKDEPLQDIIPESPQ